MRIVGKNRGHLSTCQFNLQDTPMRGVPALKPPALSFIIPMESAPISRRCQGTSVASRKTIFVTAMLLGLLLQIITNLILWVWSLFP